MTFHNEVRTARQGRFTRRHARLRLPTTGRYGGPRYITGAKSSKLIPVWVITRRAYGWRNAILPSGRAEMNAPAVPSIRLAMDADPDSPVMTVKGRPNPCASEDKEVRHDR